ncbi:hypothetical protein HO173_007206 [Letharia columbiana]|uniref:Protein kinase domain-containing protein n=1 Tax=Letharia columbiana TaxID=112416 RepID=A0A8H6L3Y0_9LECA|nr:uncharacterized protein HO173_007206 [Letharia columbiana]KAF6234580.1 hypothetical protein HO173_007206 [Letharia columbiana]
MQEAPYGNARDPNGEPFAEPSEPFSRAPYDNNSIAEQTAASTGPQIVLHRSEGLEEPWRPAIQSSHSLGRSHSSEDSSSRESLDLDAPAVGDPPDAFDIPKSIKCFFHITFDGSTAPVVANSSAIDYTDPNSYQEVEKIALDHARGAHVAKQINFKYGNCTVIGDHVEKTGLPLTTREDWDGVCAILVNYWRSDPQRTLRVDIFRDYFSYRSRATSEASLAATKRQEIHSLIKYASEDKQYIPRTALMRFNSLENIREIIIQDNRLDMAPEEKEHFIQIVHSIAPRLLALCVYAKLKMECLNILLAKRFSDANLPQQRQDCCHDKCAPDFALLLGMRGCFTAARFDNVGEHQNFHRSDVIPINFIPVEEDQDEIMKAGRQRDLEKGIGNTSRVADEAKKSACCGSGAYSNVYRVRIDPDHHRLLKNKEADFALKEFKDRPPRVDDDFQRELKVLDELSKYPLRHIVTHRATWTQEGRYYMLFPYAQCNLRQYMEWIRFGAPKKENIMWLLRQFRGLAEALKDIHNLSGAGDLQSAPNLVTHSGGDRKAGYHHDLKPENILFYKVSGNFEISDFGSSKVHTYRSGSHNTKSAHGTLTYEPPEAAGETSRPYDVWSLGCVFLEILIWAVLGFPSVKKFGEERDDRRYPGSHVNIAKDDAFWQMLQNGDIMVRKSVESFTEILREKILQQRNQPFMKVLDLVIKMLDTVKDTRILALDVYDTLDRIYKQKKIDLENVKEDSLPDNDDAQELSPYLPRLSLDPPDRRSPERTREGAAVAVRNAGNVPGDFLTASPMNSTSPHSPRVLHGWNSSASEFVGRSRNASIASSNMSTHGRHGSHDERN